MASKPLVVIVGPTASGKTSLSIKLARKYSGEIISADSRAIYKGMDIGTAKPTIEEQSLVPHWGLDLVEPGEYFSVADFKEYVVTKIDEIRTRGHVPFLVGGTGLYIDAVMFDYKFGSPADAKLRSELQQLDIGSLQAYCDKNGIKQPENSKNKRYLIRAIENAGVNPSKTMTPIGNSITVGITTEKHILRSRIDQRTDILFASGVIDEAEALGNMFGWDSEAMKSNIYPLIHQYLNGDITLDEAKERFRILDWRLAKRQMTWLRRNKFIQWLSLSDAEKYISDRLAITEQS